MRLQRNAGARITLDIFKNAILGERKGHSLCSAFMQDINVMSSLTILSMFNTIKEILRAIFLFGWLMWKVASCSGIVNKPMWNMQKKNRRQNSNEKKSDLLKISTDTLH